MRKADFVGVLAVAIVSLTLFFVSYETRKEPSGETREMHNVKVMAETDEYGYWMESEDGTKFFAQFCQDYEPQFSAGMTLEILKFEDFGRCWSVRNTHPAYIIRRDQDGRPIVFDEGPARGRNEKPGTGRPGRSGTGRPTRGSGEANESP